MNTYKVFHWLTIVFFTGDICWYISYINGFLYCTLSVLIDNVFCWNYSGPTPPYNIILFDIRSHSSVKHKEKDFVSFEFDVFKCSGCYWRRSFYWTLDVFMRSQCCNIHYVNYLGKDWFHSLMAMQLLNSWYWCFFSVVEQLAKVLLWL